MTAYCPRCGQECTDVMNDAGGWCPDHGRVYVNWQRPWPTIVVLDATGQRIAKGMETIAFDGRPDGVVREVRDEETGPVVVWESYEFGAREEFATVRMDEHDDHRCHDVEVRA